MTTTQLHHDIETLRGLARTDPLMVKLRGIADRLDDMAEDLDRCGTARLDARRGALPQTAAASTPTRSTCLHASILTAFGNGTRDDPYVTALSIGPVGGVREVMLVKRAELARVLFP